MKRNALTVAVGAIILVIFVLLLFTFQVRQTEVVVVTTFEKPSASIIEKPGLYFKWPRPIQRVIKFDKRIHNFEDRFEEAQTSEGLNILASVYVGWTIRSPSVFFSSFPLGTPESAQPALESIVRSTKQAIIGHHPFTDFISTDPKQAKFAQIETEIADGIRAAAKDKYGINIDFLGIKRIGLPESVTQKVFERMQAERQREVDRLNAEGESEAIRIRSVAERDRDEILAKARAEATAIRGQAQAEASKSFEAFKQNPDLALFLIKLQSLESFLKDRATLIVDPRTSPFDLFLKAPDSAKTLQTSPSALSSSGGVNSK